VVGRHRRALDRSATWGVPAHVTVLYPFMPPDRIGDGVITTLLPVVAAVAAFRCTFSHVRWFDDDAALLAPEPDAPFRALTMAVWDRFPDYPPYGGTYPDPIPHLTIGHAPTADLAGMRLAAADVERELPVHAWIDRVLLIAGTDAPGSWSTLTECPLRQV